MVSTGIHRMSLAFVGLLGLVVGALLSIGAWAMSPHVGPIAMTMIGMLLGMGIGGIAIGRLIVWTTSELVDSDEERRHWAAMYSVYQELIPMAKKYDRDTLVDHMDKQLEWCEEKMAPMFDDSPPCPRCGGEDTHAL